MNLLELSSSIYAWLLRLYPDKFRAQFAEEMQEAFENAIADATENGALSVIAVYVRELKDLPINVLREHLANRKRGRTRMRNHFSIHQPNRSARMGAIGFGVGMAVVGMVGGIMRGGSLNSSDLAYYLPLGVLLWAIAGAVGGAALGLSAAAHDRIRSFAFAGALACGCGFLATTFIYLLLVRLMDPFSSWLFFMSLLGNPAIFGALIGAFFGCVHRDPKGGAWLALVGAISFGLGAVGRSAVSAILTQVLLPVSGSPNVLGGLSTALLFALSLGVEGIVGGGILGLAMGKRRASESILGA